MLTITSENGLLKIPTSGEWPIFEVLLNPRQLNLNANDVFLRRGEENYGQTVGGLLPARPVLAQSAPPSPSDHKNRHPPSSYLAFCRYQDVKHFPNLFYYYPGVVVEKELGQNETLAFYYGMYSVRNALKYKVCSVYVVAVLNSKLPPLLIDYSRRRFNKL